ncbi:MAG: TonB-dependent receptor [Burkholderiales bacterium]|nr:TonB-dependent receptor [Burkholderiales bacterium]
MQVISREEIQNSGKANVAEFLQTLTSDGQGSVPFTYGRGFSGATAAGISLRGLGANATLVLINGRRAATAVLADDAQRTYVDLNTIPLEAVERVEVLKDGASSIYGSDAVAGVVNIILRKNYQGIQIKVQYGVAQEGDGAEPKVSLMYGRGDLDKDGWNLLVNVEAGKKDAIYYKDRMGRGQVGIAAIGNAAYGLGFDPNGSSNNLARLGGEGWLATDSLTAAGRPSIIGNVRNPTTNVYYSRGDTSAGTGFTRGFAGAQSFCVANSTLPQNNARGGCLYDHWQTFGQVQPDIENYNLYTRFTKKLNADTEASLDFSWSGFRSAIQREPIAFNGGVNQPNGVPLAQTAPTQLGAAHPDNPYFGTAARLAYTGGADPNLGPNRTHSDGDTYRVVGAIKGSLASWEYDAGFVYSEARQTDVAEKRIDYRTKNALLNPTAANVAAAAAFNPAYAALPAGTVLRIGENYTLNSPQVYAAMLKDQSREGYSRVYGVDAKASREIGQLAGGAMSVAVGAEIRREAYGLPFYTGLGDYTGLSLTKYSGSRDIWAVYTEGNFPITKALEASAALRYDHYSDAGNSVTPKIGAKFKPMSNLALRGTYAHGFRAPSFTENGVDSIAAFGGATVNDTARCAGTGVASSLCNGVAPTFVQQGNPNLEPEESRSTTLGMVWDLTPKTSMTLDVWQIKRTGLPVIEDPQQAINRGQLIRDPSTASNANDPGGILVGFVRFQNSAQSLTRGLDLEVKHRIDLQSMGRLNLGMTWTHLMKQQVRDAAGVLHEYAGTHGDCHITNCIGSPKDRVQMTAKWELNNLQVGGVVNYRGSFKGIDEYTNGVAAPCWSAAIANGASIPAGCTVKSFMTLDMSARYKLNDRIEIFGSIQNVFDKKPPFDPETYGAIGYNALDYSGAIGRFFRVGLRASF